jgi:DNA polymerase-1
MIIAFDTETTGTDFFNGCKPFMVTACDGESNYYWEGKVNPYDRSEVVWDKDVLQDLQSFIDNAEQIVFHNAKFDVRALDRIGIDCHFWKRIEDTLIASHVLSSGEKHGLKYLAFKYLDYYNEGENELARAVRAARQSHPEYDIAKKGHKCFPGLSGPKVKWYAMDYWLCMEECRRYGMDDVEMTWLLWSMFSKVLKSEGLVEQYNTRKALLPITYDMEEQGLNVYIEGPDGVRQEIKRLKALRSILQEQIRSECKIANDLDLTKDAHIRFFLFNILEIPIVFKTDTGAPSVNKEAMKYYIEKYPDNMPIQHFSDYKLAGTKIGYLSSYLRYIDKNNRIHSNILITGTRETRQATVSPNIQNIDKQLKHIFGPPPGYVWLCYDLVNIELRIWGYSVGNPEMVRIFNEGKSFHMEIAKILYPDLVKECESNRKSFKKEYNETLYQWIKNGNFSIIYGAGQNKADRTYQLDGAYFKIVDKFPEVPVFTKKVMDEVWRNEEIHGRPFVTCLGGYQLDVNLDSIHTTACNYYSQGSAGYIIGLSMIEVVKNPMYKSCKCQMVNQVHDSLTIQVPIEYHSKELELSLQKSIEAGGEKLLPTCEAELEAVIFNKEDKVPF